MLRAASGFISIRSSPSWQGIWRKSSGLSQAGRLLIRRVIITESLLVAALPETTVASIVSNPPLLLTLFAWLRAGLVLESLRVLRYCSVVCSSAHDLSTASRSVAV